MSSGCARGAGPRAELLEEALDRAVVAVAQSPRGDAEERPDRDLEEAAARVAREAAEEVGTEHRRHGRAVAAARLAAHAAQPVRLVALVHERHDLVAEVGVVAAAAGRVDELRAADGRPGVDEDDARVDVGVVEELEEGRAEGGAVAPHVELAGVALEHVDGRAALVAGRRVDPQRPLVRVAERVPAQRVADEHVLVERPAQLSRPRRGSRCRSCPSVRRALRSLRGTRAMVGGSFGPFVLAEIGSMTRWRARAPCSRQAEDLAELRPRCAVVARACATSVDSIESSAARVATISRSPASTTRSACRHPGARPREPKVAPSDSRLRGKRCTRDCPWQRVTWSADNRSLPGTVPGNSRCRSAHGDERGAGEGARDAEALRRRDALVQERRRESHRDDGVERRQHRDDAQEAACRGQPEEDVRPDVAEADRDERGQVAASRRGTSLPPRAPRRVRSPRRTCVP